MKSPKGYIPILIVVALLGLIGLQMTWLLNVYQYKKQELKDKTREAVLQTAERLQREEDAKLIVNNIDSLLKAEEEKIPELEKEVQLIVSQMKDKFSVKTLQSGTQEVKIVDDSGGATSVVSITSGNTRKVTIRSVASAKANPKRKAKKLEKLFLKMAVNAAQARKDIDARVDSQEVRTVLKEELLKQGIDLDPEFSVSYFPRQLKNARVDYHVLCSSPNILRILPAMVTMPLFPDDVFGGDLFIKVGYLSTRNFLIRQMAGLGALSLLITILVAFVMVYIFRRMLSQEKLHRLKNDFINNMTHELKTPIATISLATDALNNSWVRHDDVRFNEYTRIIKEEQQKLNSHVERVLQVAQLDRGELQLHKTPLDAVDLIRSRVKAHALQIEKQGAKVNFEPAKERFVVMADELHLGNVFSNLLDNALKYCSENCVVEISVTQNGKYVNISVKDNGIGIEAEAREKVFDKFYRAQGGNLHDVKGFGLGLSYARSIVDAHGGSIELRSEKGKGAEFIIKVPAHA